MVKVKLHNQELVPQRTETWHLHVLCWVSQGISQSSALAIRSGHFRSGTAEFKSTAKKVQVLWSQFTFS